jgi:membrane-associated phospholipid phosphatase
MRMASSPLNLFVKKDLSGADSIQYPVSTLKRKSRSGRTAARALVFAACLLCCLSTGRGQQITHPATDPAHKLSTKEFFKDLGGNFAGIIDVRSIAPAVIGGAATALATIPEQQIEQHFAPGDVWGAWSTPGSYIGNPVILAGVSTALFTASRKTENRKFRSLSYSLLQGTIMTAGIVQTTKAGFQRLRPNEDDTHAFPSGHAADTFMYATVFTAHYGWKAAIPGYAIATYVSATRLEERKHHLTDVTAGATIGYLVGQTVSRRILKGEKSRFGFQFRRSRSGLASTISFNLH